MGAIRIVDVIDGGSFGLVPPCADPGFDHRTCDYWEDAERGSKAARPSWLGGTSGSPAGTNPGPSSGDVEGEAPAINPFAPVRRGPVPNPFARGEDNGPHPDNPFAPRRAARPGVGPDAPRKLGVLTRGLAIFGSYAKVLLVDDRPLAYAQFGPLSAYPRALHVRELYPALPASPLPAVITCIATTPDARREGYARHLVEAVFDDLSARGFAAVETYPEVGARPDATSAATPAFWIGCGFRLAADDARFPVMRREAE